MTPVPPVFLSSFHRRYLWVLRATSFLRIKHLIKEFLHLGRIRHAILHKRGLCARIRLPVEESMAGAGHLYVLGRLALGFQRIGVGLNHCIADKGIIRSARKKLRYGSDFYIRNMVNWCDCFERFWAIFAKASQRGSSENAITWGRGSDGFGQLIA